MVLAGRPVTLATDSGVFSADRLDPGTEVMLDLCPAPSGGGDLLDLGCGYGPIAIWLAGHAPRATVWAVDVNERARALAGQNAATAGARNIRVCAPVDVPGQVEFAGIWSNPPIRIGKAALHDLLAGWLRRLHAGARCYLVVQRNLGADSLARWLAGEGAQVERLGSRRGYRVLAVTPEVTAAEPD